MENKGSLPQYFSKSQSSVPLRSRRQLFVFVHTGVKEGILTAPETKQEPLLLCEFLRDCGLVRAKEGGNGYYNKKGSKQP